MNWTCQETKIENTSFVYLAQLQRGSSFWFTWELDLKITIKYVFLEYSLYSKLGNLKLKSSLLLVILGTRPDQPLFPAEFSLISI